MRHTHVLLCLLPILAACGSDPGHSSPSAGTGGACAPKLAARLPLRIERGWLMTDIEINHSVVPMQVDTGSEAMMVTPEAQGRLNLPEDPHRTTRVHGIGGTFERRNAIIQRVSIGGLAADQASVSVGNIDQGKDYSGFVAGLIGTDDLSFYDLLFDAPHGTLSLYRAGGCGADFRPPPEAGPVAGEAKLLQSTGHRMLVETRLNGQRALAFLDTGAATTTVTRAAALRVGESPAALDTARTGHMTGADGRYVDAARVNFSSVEIAGQSFADRALTVAPISVGADMLLGADWFRTRRVWISYAAARLFLLG